MKPENFMKPGKDNKEDRTNFIKFWANYIKENSDLDWSKQQNIVINSQMPVEVKKYLKTRKN